MAISFPRTDILTAVDFEDQTFDLKSRQELSTQASGAVFGKDLGPAIWFAGYTTMPLENDDAVAYEAMLRSLDGVIFPFEASDLRRIYPRAYPTGVFSDTGVLNAINVNNKALRIGGLTAGQIISVGDYLSFDYGDYRALHQVVEGAAAAGTGITPYFEVRPHIRPGWTLSDPVVLKIPRGLFTLMPNSISSKSMGSLHSVISFQCGQYL